MITHRTPVGTSNMNLQLLPLRKPWGKNSAFRVIPSEFSSIYLFEHCGKYSPFQRKPFLWPTSLKLCPISLWPFPDQLYKRKALILCLPLLPIPIPQLLLSPFKLSPKITSHLIRVSQKAHFQPSCYFMCLCSKQDCSLSSPSVKFSSMWCWRYHSLKLYLLSFKPLLLLAGFSSHFQCHH